MKTIKIVLQVFLLTVALQALAQPAINNDMAHRRYWYYRTRMINDFMKIGSQQGDCIVFAERNVGNGSKAKVGPDQIDITNQYLAALALEYKLLSRNHQSTDETLKEIYHLLHTINRLDSRAEWFWQGAGVANDSSMATYPETPNLNGFILREDMPKSYMTTYNNRPHYNYGTLEDPATNESFTGLPAIDGLTTDNKFSDYSGFVSYTSLPKSDLSLPHDKYYSMFTAFMLLIKYIPDNTSYYENGVQQGFQDGLSDIKAEVRAITGRCHSYLRGNTFGGNLTDWILEYPDGTNLQQLGQPILYSYPLSKMICYIMNGYPWGWPCNAEQDAVSLSVGFASYNALAVVPIPLSDSSIKLEDATVFQGYCMAGSNAPIFTPTFPPIPIPAGIAMDLNSSLNSVEWADLLRKVLHQSGPLMKQKSVYANPISSAPCIGPYNFNNCDHGGFEWSSQDRLEHPSARGAGCETQKNPITANYPGVDYMFLHNLYYEFLNQENDNGSNQTGEYFAYNFMDNYDRQIWPQMQRAPTFFQHNSQSIYGVNLVSITGSGLPNTLTIKMPAYIKLFQNLSSRAQIYASASPLAPNNTIGSKVGYRAGKEVALLPEDANQPGFSVEEGSEFSAVVKRYLCRESDYGNGMRTMNDTLSSAYDYETDSMNTELTIHELSNTPLSDSDLYPQTLQDNDSITYPAARLAHISANDQLKQNALQTKLSDAGNETEFGFSIIPNPNNGLFKVIITKTSNDAVITLTLFDMKGTVILQEKNYATREIDLRNYPKGIYLAQITSDSGYIHSKKISVTE